MLEAALAALAVAAFAVAALRTPWRRFREPAFQHLFLGACVATLFLWQMRPPIETLLPIHLLCLTTVTLMFGAPLAMLGGAVVAAATCAAGLDDWSALPRVFVASAVVPVLVSGAILRASQRLMPPNLFVYIFVGAFFGAAAAMTAAALTNAALLLGLAEASLADIRAAYFPVLPLLAFPEAFVNGALVTGLVVFKPLWIPSFDDRRYLRR